MSYEAITRITDLVFLIAGVLIGAWVYHRGYTQQPPIPTVKVPSIVRRKQPEKAKLDLPTVGA